ncbi:acylphosphatase [Chelativorans salis]|uniref:Acylphosphatase n=1 Tax=Chelativorans salis TaxID=2978478 RepID=A0ABT2LR63_9HYPH|nr:acylphosphatase [Chelativorans sp. EGI FJ00035]MCT7377040.1 acylphosphatase [Chelativorans sp. EGI FJ00035]
MKDGLEAKHVRVTGRVQGVNFRAWTRAEAERLGLTGWVRNEPDGAVTAFIVGPGAAVETMLERLGEGPPAARVAGVSAEATDSEEAPDRFAIVY